MADKYIKFIAAVDILAEQADLNPSIDKFKKKFTPSPNAPLIGKWSNLKGGFKTSILHFYKDGSGQISNFVSTLIAWQDVKGNKRSNHARG